MFPFTVVKRSEVALKLSPLSHSRTRRGNISSYDEMFSDSPTGTLLNGVLRCSQGHPRSVNELLTNLSRGLDYSVEIPSLGSIVDNCAYPQSMAEYYLRKENFDLGRALALAVCPHFGEFDPVIQKEIENFAEVGLFPFPEAETGAARRFMVPAVIVHLAKEMPKHATQPTVQYLYETARNFFFADPAGEVFGERFEAVARLGLQLIFCSQRRLRVTEGSVALCDVLGLSNVGRSREKTDGKRTKTINIWMSSNDWQVILPLQFKEVVVDSLDEWEENRENGVVMYLKNPDNNMPGFDCEVIFANGFSMVVQVRGQQTTDPQTANLVDVATSIRNSLRFHPNLLADMRTGTAVYVLFSNKLLAPEMEIPGLVSRVFASNTQCKKPDNYVAFQDGDKDVIARSILLLSREALHKISPFLFHRSFEQKKTSTGAAATN